MKRYLNLLPLLLVAASCSHHSSPPTDSQDHIHLVIVGTNDLHGNIRPKETKIGTETLISQGSEWFAAYIRVLQKKYGDSLIMLDGGDIFQGTMESNQFLGKSVIDVYNRLPYRALALGNHEFDYGPANKNSSDRLGALKERIDQSKIPFVSSNIKIKSTGKPWREKNLHPFTIFTVEGLRIGVIGLTTVTTPQKTRPQNVQSLEFEDLKTATLRTAKILRESGCDLVFITAHEGGTLPDDPMPALFAELPAGTVDAAVTGHTHTIVTGVFSGVPTIQSKAFGQYFGRMDLYVDRKTKKVDAARTKIFDPIPICGNFLQSNDNCNAKAAKEPKLPLRPATYEGEILQADLEIRELLAAYFATIDQRRQQAVFTLPRELKQWPSGDKEVGQIFADALKAAYPEAKAAYQNGGGIRRNLNAGPVSYGDLFEVMPFDNMAVLVPVTGKDLRRLIEIGVAGEQSIPYVSGVTFSYYADDKPEYDRDLNGDGKKEKWERQRLKDLRWTNGKPVRDEEIFTLLTNDFLLDGGDRLGLVFEQIPRSRVRIMDTPLLDAVVEQLKKPNKFLAATPKARIFVAAP